MARRKDHTREELKALILEAAWQIVGEEGLSALTARRIGAHVGYAPGTIYNVFPSMNSLILHLNARTLDLLYDELAIPPSSGNNVMESMKNMAERYVCFATTHRPYWMALFTADLGGGRQKEAWYADKIESLFNPLERLLHDRFKQRGRDEITADARILWSSVHGLTYLALTGKLPLKDGDLTLESLIGQLIETYISGASAR